jgi:hypothetical protein
MNDADYWRQRAELSQLRLELMLEDGIDLSAVSDEGLEELDLAGGLADQVDDLARRFNAEIADNIRLREQNEKMLALLRDHGLSRSSR